MIFGYAYHVCWLFGVFPALQQVCIFIFVFAWSQFTALQQVCVLYILVFGWSLVTAFTACLHLVNCCLARRHVCILYIAYHVYSAIDPSGI